jgi:hypothetical protein
MITPGAKEQMKCSFPKAEAVWESGKTMMHIKTCSVKEITRRRAAERLSQPWKDNGLE